MSTLDWKSRAHKVGPIGDAFAYCFTLNNPTYQECYAINSLLTRENKHGIIYYGYGLENYKQFVEPKPEGGQFHLQGVIVSKLKITLANLKKIARRAHWEQMNSSLSACIIYCSKEGKFVSMGDYATASIRIGKNRRFPRYELNSEVEQYRPAYVHAFLSLYLHGSNLGDLGEDFNPSYDSSSVICFEHRHYPSFMSTEQAQEL